MCCQVWCYDKETSLVSRMAFSFLLHHYGFSADSQFTNSLSPPSSSRHCGRLLCHKCSIKEIPVIKFDLNKPVRVCDICFDVLTLGGVS